MFASVYSMCVSQFVDVVASPVKLVVSVTVCGVAARAPIVHDHRQGLMIHGCIIRVTAAVIMQVAARFLESTALRGEIGITFTARLLRRQRRARARAVSQYR